MCTFIWKRWLPWGEFIYTMSFLPTPKFWSFLGCFWAVVPNFVLKHAVACGFEQNVPPWRRKSWRKIYSDTIRMQNQATLAAGAHRGHESRKYPTPEGVRRGKRSWLFMYFGSRDLPPLGPYGTPPSLSLKGVTWWRGLLGWERGNWKGTPPRYGGVHTGFWHTPTGVGLRGGPVPQK